MADQLTVSLHVGEDQLTTRSYTTSCAPMWTQAGVDLEAYDGSRAIHALPDLQNAVEAMKADPATYEALNPTDGSGDYTGCLGFLEGLVDDCNRHPKAVTTATIIAGQ
ncbi:hypothetical protein DMH04_41370 [Kibdelosporangium aridum]|uniref:Uncharacterized protein n=1 Tax=Kibdelosporangium aridum TaxID=2030 RepID=A0A428YUT7_KIBAR|nr:hypothetical protein [Kibdelosporangium aridum]RSM73464.1 hypothetical protein DMH04_41370 [Kibdelosporangium aridum]